MPKMTEPLARAAATDAGNQSMRAASRTAWSLDDYNAAVATYDRLTAEPPERVTCVQTSCRHCGLDIENLHPFPSNGWRDRGNNTHCNDAQHLHAPHADWRTVYGLSVRLRGTR